MQAYIQTGRQAYRQHTGRLAYIHTIIHKERHTSIHTGRQSDRQGIHTYIQTYRQQSHTGRNTNIPDIEPLTYKPAGTQSRIHTYIQPDRPAATYTHTYRAT